MTLIDPVLLKDRLATLAGRFDVDALEECDSTNSELMRRAERGAPSGSVVVADRQAAGRGRRGRQWLSSPEDSLTFSVLWRFPKGVSLAGLSLVVGVAVAKALTHLGATNLRLKWPNDILLACEGDYAKLGGILIELVSDRKGIQAIVGIGLNLLAPRAELPQPVAGLAQAMNVLPERNALLASVLMELAVEFDKFAVHGFPGAKTEWQAMHAWQDRPVSILGETDGPKGGICRGVDDDGSLLLETDAGIERVLSGDVSLRRA